MPKYDCQNYCGDMKNEHDCKVSGRVQNCPDECECYTDRFGHKPYADQTEIERFLKGET